MMRTSPAGCLPLAGAPHRSQCPGSIAPLSPHTEVPPGGGWDGDLHRYEPGTGRLGYLQWDDPLLMNTQCETSQHFTRVTGDV